MDPLLVYTVSVLAMAGMAVVFVVNCILHPSPQAGPWWELAFLSGVLCATAYFIGQRTGDAGWTVSVGNATMVFTLGAAWAGCVVFNGRRAPTRVLSSVLVIGGSLAIGVISVLPSEYGTKYAGAVEKGTALAAFSLLALIECLRGPLRSYVGARVMAVVFGLHLAYLAPRSVVYLALGPTSEVFATVFNTAITTGMNVVFTVIVEAAMLGIQAQHRRRMPTGSGFRPYPDAIPRGHEGRRLDGPLLVIGVDLWIPLRRAYGVDLANDLSLHLARAIAVTLEETEDRGPGAGARTGAVAAAEVWRLPEGRFVVRRAPGVLSTESGVRAVVGRVRSEFAARAALPEGRPTVSAVVVLPAAAALPGAAPVAGVAAVAGVTAVAGAAAEAGAAALAERETLTEGEALAAAEAEFKRRRTDEIDWIAVVRPDEAVGASLRGSPDGSDLIRPVG